jgi:hypothetical protein
MKIAFDIDHTLWKIVKGADGKHHQVPDYDLIQVLRWFHSNGDEVFIWSAGGVDYAQTIANKLGLDTLAKIIPKGIYGEPGSGLKVDLCFDDEDVKLASVNIKISREPFEDPGKFNETIKDSQENYENNI